jgi:hypothetical protein
VQIIRNCYWTCEGCSGIRKSVAVAEKWLTLAIIGEQFFPVRIARSTSYLHPTRWIAWSDQR